MKNESILSNIIILTTLGGNILETHRFGQILVNKIMYGGRFVSS